MKPGTLTPRAKHGASVDRALKALKPRLCAAEDCSELFVPRNGLQTAHSPRCAAQVARQKAAKREARQRRDRLEQIKPLRELAGEAQRHLNAWIRLRDKDEPCISCDLPATWGGQWHASHYRSIGACPELRFDERNIHKSCSACNSHKSGNIVEYRLRLIQRIGQAAVDELEGPHPPKKYTADELRAIRDDYRGRAREAKKA